MTFCIWCTAPMPDGDELCRECSRSQGVQVVIPIVRDPDELEAEAARKLYIKKCRQVGGRGRPRVQLDIFKDAAP